ncbi:MAG: hypothetical protein AB9891_17700 [Anaerolineaceae bacterium]
MFQTHVQTIRPLTTAHLAQTMTLLSLTVDELKQQIDSELAANPALELVEERRCPTCHRLLPPKTICPVCSKPQSPSLDEPIVFVSPRDDFYSKGEHSGEETSEDNYSSETEDLPTYVLKQIAPDLEPQMRLIAAYFLTHLDEDGLLTIQLDEIARYFHIPVEEVLELQQTIQKADPIGVGSLSPQEALLVQIEVLSETRPVPELAREIVLSGITNLSRHQNSELAKQFKVSQRVIQQVMTFISDNLNPYPARSYWGDVRDAKPTAIQVYHQPDILISHLNDNPENQLVVEIILPISGTLRVNPLFRQAIRQADDDKKGEWRSDLDRASLFVKCLQQRNHTVTRLMSRLVGMQKEFICFGERHLKPITRAQLSVELEVHESTISRAVANKTVLLPNGRIVPLALFFDRSLNVRTLIKNIIEKETSCLSDTALVELLTKHGFDIARRTVAKYRAMEGILPAHLRHASQQSR